MKILATPCCLQLQVQRTVSITCSGRVVITTVITMKYQTNRLNFLNVDYWHQKVTSEKSIIYISLPSRCQNPENRTTCFLRYHRHQDAADDAHQKIQMERMTAANMKQKVNVCIFVEQKCGVHVSLQGCRGAAGPRGCGGAGLRGCRGAGACSSPDDRGQCSAPSHPPRVSVIYWSTCVPAVNVKLRQ